MHHKTNSPIYIIKNHNISRVLTAFLVQAYWGDVLKLVKYYEDSYIIIRL